MTPPRTIYSTDHPVYLAIVKQLAAGQQPTEPSIAKETYYSLSRTHTHMVNLEQAGLIRRVKINPTRVYVEVTG